MILNIFAISVFNNLSKHRTLCFLQAHLDSEYVKTLVILLYDINTIKGLQKLIRYKRSLFRVTSPWYQHTYLFERKIHEQK